jgi:hypothetical protein
VYTDGNELAMRNSQDRQRKTSLLAAVWGKLICRSDSRQNRDTIMENLPIQPIIAILAGILILLRPELLNYVVALYLIVIGVLGIVGSRRL